MLNKETTQFSAMQEVSLLSVLEQENRALRAKVAELERLVVCDALTPVSSRRHFMHELERWCWRARLHGGEYGLLFIDVDNLKSVNDAHGHLTGDMLLVSIAETLQASVGRFDLVARVGGDEFAILLDGVPVSEMASKAQQISTAVRMLNVSYQGISLAPSVSTGFTAIEAGVKPAELLMRADQSMYAAKQGKGIDPRR
jgi:diguanylate cyclase (GGDEF)-like protein